MNTEAKESLTRRYFGPNADEPGTTACLKTLLRTARTFVDVGAGFGQYVQLACYTMNRRGRIIAFEPDPERFEVLNRNCRQWIRALPGDDPLAVTALKLAVSDGGPSRRMFLADGVVSAAHTMTPRLAERDGVRQTDVPAMTLDMLGLAPDRDDPVVVKIDTEGHELAVLRGARKLLLTDAAFVVEVYAWGHPELVLTELHRHGRVVKPTHDVNRFVSLPEALSWMLT